MKRTITALALTTALVLTGCGDPNEWDSPQQRDEAFAQYACQRMSEEEPSLVGSTASSEAFEMELSTVDRASLVRHATLVTAGTVTPTCDAASPDYSREFQDAWQRAMEEQEGSDFTPAVARERGIID